MLFENGDAVVDVDEGCFEGVVVVWVVDVENASVHARVCGFCRGVWPDAVL